MLFSFLVACGLVAGAVAVAVDGAGSGDLLLWELSNLDDVVGESCVLFTIIDKSC